MIIKCERKEGITLIALVITIIVLLILAGVTINMVVGQNGIFNKATTAKEETKQQTILEAWNLLNAESTLYEQTGKEGLEEEKIKSKLEEAGIIFGENSYPTWEEFKNGSTITIKEKIIKYAELYTGKVELSTVIVNVTSENNTITDYTGKTVTITNINNNTDTQNYTLQAGEISHEFRNVIIGKEYNISIDVATNNNYLYNIPTIEKFEINKENNIANLEYIVKGKYLYNEGIRNIAWDTYANPNYTSYGNVTFNEKNVYIFGDRGMRAIISTEKQDFTNWKKIVVEGTSQRGMEDYTNYEGFLAIGATPYKTGTEENVYANNNIPIFREPNGKIKMESDISSINSNYYVLVGAHGNTGYISNLWGKYNITKIYFLK